MGTDHDRAVVIRRGPRTAEGRARVSRNGLKHGLTAEKHLVLDHEDPAALLALQHAIRSEFNAEGEYETRLADRIALCLFKEARADRIEVALMDYTFQETLTAGVDLHAEPQRFQRACIALTSNDWLANNDRYLTANERRMRTAVQEIRAHQAARRTGLALSPGSYHITVPPHLFATPSETSPD